MRSRDSKQAKRIARQNRVRATVKGTSSRPRLCVFKSLTNIYAQVIDDENQVTLVSASTLDADVKTKASNVEAAKEVGTLVAKRAIEKNIDTVVDVEAGATSLTVNGYRNAVRDALAVFEIINETK